MSETTTTTCCYCRIKQEPEFQLYNVFKLFEFPSGQDVNLINGSSNTCIKCKMGVDDVHQLRTEYVYPHSISSLIKEEIKQELDEDEIKSEDTPLYSERSYSVSVFYCYHCNYGTDDKKNLIHHVFTHRFKCNLCSYTTPENYVLMDHKQIHLSMESLHKRTHLIHKNIVHFVCKVCAFNAPSENGLKSHMLMHTYVPATNSSYFKSHTRKQFRQLKEELMIHRFNCDKCDYKTNIKSSLESHKKKHSKEKPFKCNFCDFCSKYSGSLKEHLKIHSSERPFICDKCDYNTYYKFNLEKHQRIHSKEKPFKCNLCDFCTKHSWSLKEHLMRHSGEPPYSCDICDYKTFNKFHLVRHKRIHSKEKPFKCSFCDFCSKHSHVIKMHIMRHSGEPLCCDKCNYKTFNKFLLTRHMRIHRREDYLNINYAMKHSSE